MSFARCAADIEEAFASSVATAGLRARPAPPLSVKPVRPAAWWRMARRLGRDVSRAGESLVEADGHLERLNHCIQDAGRMRQLLIAQFHLDGTEAFDGWRPPGVDERQWRRGVRQQRENLHRSSAHLRRLERDLEDGLAILRRMRDKVDAIAAALSHVRRPAEAAHPDDVAQADRALQICSLFERLVDDAVQSEIRLCQVLEELSACRSQLDGLAEAA